MFTVKTAAMGMESAHQVSSAPVKRDGSGQTVSLSARGATFIAIHQVQFVLGKVSVTKMMKTTWRFVRATTAMQVRAAI